MKYYSRLINMMLIVFMSSIYVPTVYAEKVIFHPPKSLTGTFKWDDIVACYDLNGKITNTNNYNLIDFCYIIKGQAINKYGETIQLDGQPIVYTSHAWNALPMLSFHVRTKKGHEFNGTLIADRYMPYRKCALLVNILVCDKEVHNAFN